MAYPNERGARVKQVVLPLAAALALWALCAHAGTRQGTQAIKNWKQMDSCAKEAQTAYPDFDADSNAKRDAKLKGCLNVHQLPPREPFSQPGAQ
jgi:hypothetical protein